MWADYALLLIFGGIPWQVRIEIHAFSLFLWHFLPILANQTARYYMSQVKSCLNKISSKCLHSRICTPFHCHERFNVIQLFFRFTFNGSCQVKLLSGRKYYPMSLPLDAFSWRSHLLSSERLQRSQVMLEFIRLFYSYLDPKAQVRVKKSLGKYFIGVWLWRKFISFCLMPFSRIHVP